MPPVRPFLTSLYLSLAIAILAIGIAGGDLLPELPLVTGFSLAMLALAYVIEGRWELSLRNANLFGLGLSALLGLWVIFQFVRQPTGMADSLPWPASALPYMAPVLMVLIPAKMLRPKHTGDYWTMHGLGLLAMALSCALAMDGLFILVFIVYSVTFVWSLCTFHLYREVGPELAHRPLAGGRWRMVRLAILCAAVTGAAAMPVFWATPRSGSQWELALNSRGRSTGVTDGPVDLNKVGTVSLNAEHAFEFRATTAAGQPMLDFPTDQRFRAVQLHNYEGGRWVRNQSGILSMDRAYSPQYLTSAPYSRLPDLGPRVVYINYILQPRLTRTPPLADPVAWRAGQISPVLSRFDDNMYRNWVHLHNGVLDGAFDIDAGKPQYMQAWVAPERPGLGPVMRVVAGSTGHLTRLPRGLTRLKSYTDNLVERIVIEGGLPRAVLSEVDPDTQLRLPKHHQAIALALERHLASSDEFTYTLDLTRQDRSIDPAEDFLFNTKSGHCQRFATALVLMLRTQGVPCQMVIGYRGCDSRGDGWYDVREDHAHAWVEMLLQVPDIKRPHDVPWDNAVSGEGATGAAVVSGALVAHLLTLPDTMVPVRWVTLDPTPGDSSQDSNTAGTLLDQARQRWESVLKALLLAYNQESRDHAATALTDWLTEDHGLFYLIGGAAVLIGLTMWRRRAHRRALAFAAYPPAIRRLAIALTRSGHHWEPGQTAKEYARLAGEYLGTIPATTAVSGVPDRVVSVYYSERFGGSSPNGDANRMLDLELRMLERALR